MYNSKIYIKMCEKSLEIQNLWNLQIADWFWNKCGFVYWVLDDADMGVYFKEPKVIWLPRQDQLQEIVRTSDWLEDKDIYYMAYWFHSFTHGGYELDEVNEYSLKFNSMEQLWLAFVMKEMYGKVWNGVDWVE